MKRLALLSCLLILLALTSPALAQTSTPTPVPTPNPLGNDPMFQALATANSNLNNANVDLTAPNGSSILPSADGHEIFGYAKWLISAGAVDELFGPFAPIFLHLGIYVAGSIALTVIYTIVFVVAYMIRFVVFLYKVIIDTIDTIADVVQAIAEAGKAAIGAALGFLGL